MNNWKQIAAKGHRKTGQFWADSAETWAKEAQEAEKQGNQGHAVYCLNNACERKRFAEAEFATAEKLEKGDELP